jgi:DNA modification methylase
MSGFSDDFVSIIHGDSWELAQTLAPQSIDCVVTSPPYWGLRDYGEDGQFGLEPTPEQYVSKIVDLFARLRPALRDDCTVWLNLGDSFVPTQTRSNDGLTCYSVPALHHGKPSVSCGVAGIADCDSPLVAKNLVGIPWRVAFALQADGWYLRSEVVWAKPNGMPGSQTDRCTSSHESVFLLSKMPVYWSDFDAIKTPPKEATLVRLAQDVQSQAGSHRANGGGKTNGAMKAVGGKQRGHSRRHAGFNDRWDAMTREQQALPAMMRDVWFVSPDTFSEAHFAVMPREIARRCILAGCPEGGTVLDPFMGSGTTAQVARSLGRKAIGFELNADYIDIAAKHRLAQLVLL